MLSTTKTKPSKKPAGSGFMDLGNIEGLLGAQTVKTSERQQEEVKATATQQALEANARREANIVRDQAQAESADIQGQQLEILNGINGQLTKAQEAMRLADSDNPMDRLSLWFLQSQDPSYTREGNLARIQYLQQASGAVGDVNVIKQQGFNEQINAIQADMEDAIAGSDDRLALAKLSEAQGQELIDAEVIAQNTRLGIMQTQQSMQTSALANLTDDQVAKAAETASSAPNQVANVGGIEVPLAALQDRQRIIKERRYNERVMQAGAASLALGQMDVTQVMEIQEQAAAAKDRNAVVDGVKIPLGLIQDRLFTLNNQEFAQTEQQASMISMQEELLVKSQDKILEDMSTVELQQMVTNGYKDQNGLRFNPERVRYFRDARTENDTQVAQQSAVNATAANPAATAASMQSQIDTVISNLPPASPVMSNLNQSRAAVAHATQMIANATNPQETQVGHALLAAAQESINASIEGEAKRLSDNDKDLEAAYKYVLTGQAIPTDSIESAMANAAKKGLPVGRWLTGEHNALFKTTYHGTLSALEADPANVMLDSDSKKQLAMQEAQNAVMNAIAGPIDTQIQIAQVSYPGHPLKGVIRPDEFANMVRTADDQGLAAYAEALNLPQEEIVALRSGQKASPELVAKQNSMLFQALERKRPGLGHAYVEWWGSEDRTAFVSNVLQQNMQAASGDFTKMSELSLIMPHVQASMGSQSNFLASGMAESYAADIQAQHAQYITFGNNPQAKQIFMLEQTPGLTTQEKQIGMQQVIQPLLDEASQNGAKSIQEVTMYVETRLRTYEAPTPQASRVLTKLLTGRDAALKVVDDFIGINTSAAVGPINYTAGAFNMPSIAGAQMNNAAKSYSWYTDLVNGGGVAPTAPIMNRGMN